MMKKNNRLSQHLFLLLALTSTSVVFASDNEKDDKQKQLSMPAAPTGPYRSHTENDKSNGNTSQVQAQAPQFIPPPQQAMPAPQFAQRPQQPPMQAPNWNRNQSQPMPPQFAQRPQQPPMQAPNWNRHQSQPMPAPQWTPPPAVPEWVKNPPYGPKPPEWVTNPPPRPNYNYGYPRHN